MVVILGLAFVFALGIYLAIYGLGSAELEPSERLKIFEEEQPNKEVIRQDEPRGLRRILAYVGEPIFLLANRIQPQNKLLEELGRADLNLRPSEFYVIRLISGIVLAGLAFLRTDAIIAALLMFIVGYYAPKFYLRHLESKRLKQFNAQLDGALTQISNSLKAGYSLMQSLDAAAHNSVPPISTELSRVVKEVALGLSLEEALNNLLKRVQSDDLELLVTAINIHQQIGGNLSEIIDNISYTIRERVRIKGEVRTLTAQARGSGWIISLLPVILGLLLYFIAPTYFRPMLQSVVGFVILGIAFVLILLGNFFIRRIVQIEV